MKKIQTYFELEAGSITTKKENGVLKFLTIYRKKMNDYTFPKGHVENDESLEETVVRETFEETGHKIKVKDFIDSFEYKVKEKKSGEDAYIIRRVYFYEGEEIGESVKANNPDIKEGKIIPEWLTYEEALEKFNYDTDKNLLKKIFIKNNTNNHLEYSKKIINSILDIVKTNIVVKNSLLKLGTVGSVNDKESISSWSDLDLLFILKSDNSGAIDIKILKELRNIHSFIVARFPNIEISFLTHTYDDFKNYVSFDYLNHYKFATFYIENDDIDFESYINKIIDNRQIKNNTKERYSIYHLRHLRFNLIRKVISNNNNKESLKLIVDKTIESMIPILTFNKILIKGKKERLEKIKEVYNKEVNFVKIFEQALKIRSNWNSITEVSDSEVEQWLINFNIIISFILNNNTYPTPEELINPN